MTRVASAAFLLAGSASYMLAQDAPIPGLEPSIREQARTVVKSDREFLDDLNSKAAPSENPLAPPSTVQPAASSAIKPAQIPVRPRRGDIPREEAPAVAPSTREAPHPAPNMPPAYNESTVDHFVREFIRASEGATPEGELALYADRVRYFDSGTLSHEAIEKDQRRYYHRWPRREFTLVEEPHVIRQGIEGFTVHYRLHYRLYRGDETASGQTEHILTLRSGEDGLKITGIQERKAPTDRSQEEGDQGWGYPRLGLILRSGIEVPHATAVPTHAAVSLCGDHTLPPAESR